MRVIWIIRNRRTDREVQKLTTFNAAMNVLSNFDGEWSANWSTKEIMKGDHYLTVLEED